MRCLALILLLPLGACSPQKPDHAALNQIEAQQRRDSADDGRIECAKPGTTDLSRDCMVERADSPGGLVLTIRHPDGAFRRLLVTRDGRGVVAADGAEPAVVRIVGVDQIEVAVAGERYLLPATVKGTGPAQ